LVDLEGCTGSADDFLACVETTYFSLTGDKHLCKNFLACQQSASESHVSLFGLARRGDMKSHGKVPWPKVHDYLLRVESCQTVHEFMFTACAEVQKLIPFDATAGIFSLYDGRYLDGIGAPESVNASYNNYYRTRQPACLSGKLKHQEHWDVLFGPIINWHEHKNLDYAVDFMIPNGFCKSLSKASQGHQITLAIQRSRLSPDFTETEVSILEMLNHHLNSLHQLLDRKGDSADSHLSAQGIADRFHALSRREVELCLLVAHRLDTAEIAASLFVSHRTVEKHIENIFEKLEVRSRDQLRKKLAVNVAPVRQLFLSLDPDREHRIAT
jgi:DNA-binding CsgD family transcriptional regulator